MGRRDRERKQAIVEGRARSITQGKRDLMAEVVRRASRILFETADPNALVDTMQDEIINAVIAVLPDSLDATHTRTFTVSQISADKAFHEMASRVVAGVLVKCQGKFRRVSNGAWTTRKRRGKPKGRWKYCAWCGEPFYTPRSKCHQRYSSTACYWKAYRAGVVAETPDFAYTGSVIE